MASSADSSSESDGSILGESSDAENSLPCSIPGKVKVYFLSKSQDTKEKPRRESEQQEQEEEPNYDAEQQSRQSQEIDYTLTTNMSIPNEAWASLTDLSLYLSCALKRLVGPSSMLTVRRVLRMELEEHRRFLSVLPYPSRMTEVPLCQSDLRQAGVVYQSTVAPLVERHIRGQVTLTFKLKVVGQLRPTPLPDLKDLHVQMVQKYPELLNDTALAERSCNFCTRTHAVEGSKFPWIHETQVGRCSDCRHSLVYTRRHGATKYAQECCRCQH